MFKITRDTLAALLAIAPKDDPREWLNAVYFYSDGFNSYAVAPSHYLVAQQQLGGSVQEHDLFGVPAIALEVALFAAKKTRTPWIEIEYCSGCWIKCGVEINIPPVVWEWDRPLSELLAAPDSSRLGPNSGSYNARYVAQIADLMASDDPRQRWAPVHIRTDYANMSGYVDTGKTKARIMGIVV